MKPVLQIVFERCSLLMIICRMGGEASLDASDLKSATSIIELKKQEVLFMVIRKHNNVDAFERIFPFYDEYFLFFIFSCIAQN
jgi:hypothetical protein